MSNNLAAVAPVDPITQLRLAREVAADMRDLDEILRIHDVSMTQWDALQGSARFQTLLHSTMQEWESVKNTAERVKVKSLAFVEEALPEFYARVHDGKETLSAKNEVLKTISRLAGLGGPVEGVLAGERMVITINLGNDDQLKFDKGQEMPVIDLSAGDYEQIGEVDGVTYEVTDEEYETNQLEGVDLDANDELGEGVQGDEGDEDE